ncbi:MAG: NFACT RNA binding domain-containing protein [Bacteroidota bacterium]
MFHNFFFLKRLAEALKPTIVGMKLCECFSQNKDELILGFANQQKEFFIKASLLPEICLLQFPNEFKKANKNYVDLYSEIIGQQVSDVWAFDYERSFKISLENTDLIFKMHGSRSNILIAKDGVISRIFKNQLKNDLSIKPAELARDIKIDQTYFNALNGDLRKVLPALGKEAVNYLNEQDYKEKSLAEKWRLFTELLDQLDNNPIRIYKDEVPKISLLPLNEELVLETNDPILAANEFYSLFTYNHYLHYEKSIALRQIDKAIGKCDGYIENSQKKLEELKTRRNYEEIGHLIMANLHQIKQGSKVAKLLDFYHGNEIEIKLKETLSPQKNAEQYYRKSKNQKKEVEILERNISTKEAELLDLLQKREEITALDEIKQLRKHAINKEAKQSNKNEPFIRYQFMDYEILIGRNAKQNDELTLKYATKNDLWLHAKDVAGSHVVIKVHPGKTLPNPVIERAAQLAAWNSKRKNETLCPVIYIPKKFVRKRKGDPPGAMVVEREEIVMVEPKGLG